MASHTRAHKWSISHTPNNPYNVRAFGSGGLGNLDQFCLCHENESWMEIITIRTRLSEGVVGATISCKVHLPPFTYSYTPLKRRGPPWVPVKFEACKSKAVRRQQRAVCQPSRSFQNPQQSSKEFRHPCSFCGDPLWNPRVPSR